MSLNRVSYLESWQHNPASSRRQQHDDTEEEAESDDDLAYHELPEPSLASSFQSSTFTHPSLRNRLSFNPYAGPGWNEASVDDPNDDRNSILRVPSPIARQNQRDGTEREEQDSYLKTSEWLQETTGAFEISPTKRIVQVCLAVISCFLAAGIVFGFAALKPILLREGVYRHLCSQKELEGGPATCYGQELRLNMMFTIAAVATNVSALPVGTILDAYGPRVCGVIGSIFLALGALLFGLAASLPFDAYIPGYLFMSLGGPFVFISSFQLSNTFPASSGLILSALTGAFDASSALFLIFRLINETTEGSFTSEKFFLLYLVVPLFILITQLSIMPAKSYKTTGELVQEAVVHINAELQDRVDEEIGDRHEGERQRNDRRMRRQSVVSKIQDLLTNNHKDPSEIEDPVLGTGNEPNVDNTTPRQTQQGQTAPPNTHTAGGVWGVLHGYTAMQQIRSPWFILITLFTVLQMLRINYFVASLRQQYEYLFSSAKEARKLNETFDFLLPIGGLMAVPFIGTILDTTSTPFVLFVLATTATVIGILGCIPDSIHAGYANIILFVIYRPFYYTTVSDYAAKVFGFQTFGKVYGLTICLAGIGNFAQAGLDALTFQAFHRNPIPVNAVLTFLTVVCGVALVGFVWWRARSVPVTAAAVSEAVEQPSATLENGSLPNGGHDGIVTRDWEREPLLRRVVRPGGSSPSYGISSTP